MSNTPISLPVFISALLFACTAFTQEETVASPLDRSLSPYFLVKGGADGADRMPLQSTAATVNIAGCIADVMVTQTYVNSGSWPLEAIYVFPGSTNAAVYGMAMQVGQRSIIARIRERQKAREDYEQAKSEGRRASLLEQERPNVFQMNVANIMPGDTIRVMLRYTELLVPEGGEYQFVYPTVVGPRYVGAKPEKNEGFTAMPYLKSGEAPSYAFDLNLHLAAGMPLQDVKCPTHKIGLNRSGSDIADVRLDPAERAGGNRDFILRYALRGDKVQTGLLLFDDGKEKFFLCMAQPPKRVGPAQIPPREYIFVIDVSGSMNGFPLDVSKKLLRELSGQLAPEDRFNVILFAGVSNLLAEKSLPASAENVAKAIAFIDKQEGGGGTELLPALKRALELPRQVEGLSRSTLVITDGYVDVESSAFDLVRKHLDETNVFAFGIGSSVNRHLMEGLAHVGMGSPFFVTKAEESEAVAAKFRRYVSAPVLTQIAAQFDGFEAYDLEPMSIPDVMADRPVVLFGKWRGTPKGYIRIRGYSGTAGPHSAKNRRVSFDFSVADVAPDPRNAALKYLWARQKIKFLDDYAELDNDPIREAKVTELGLNYSLLTAYTSFIAIEEIAANNDPKNLKTVKQALPMPDNVSDYAVGFDLGIAGISGLNLNLESGSGMARLGGILLALLLLAGVVAFCWKKGRKAVSAALPLLLFVIVLGSCSRQPINYVQGHSVTFLLGEDRSHRNPYFARAATYFRQDAVEKTDLVIDNCTSLLAVRDFLTENRPRQGGWKRVNLVVHGNAWTGMNVPLAPGTPRTSAKSLGEALSSGNWPGLPAEALDSAAEIVVHGCNLGRDTALLRALSQAFATAGGRGPLVCSARGFSLFDAPVERPEAVQRYLAEGRSVIFPAGQFPGNHLIAKELAANYPNDTIDWQAALSRLHPDEAGAPYVHYFFIPVKWLAVYPNTASRARVALDQPADQLKWVEQQPELHATLAGIGIAPDRFRWQFRDSTYTLPDGRTVPAIAAEGLANVYCVLQPLKEVRDGRTAMVTPKVGDGRYYSLARY